MRDTKITGRSQDENIHQRITRRSWNLLKHTLTLLITFSANIKHSEKFLLALTSCNGAKNSTFGSYDRNCFDERWKILRRSRRPTELESQLRVSNKISRDIDKTNNKNLLITFLQLLWTRAKLHRPKKIKSSLAVDPTTNKGNLMSHFSIYSSHTRRKIGRTSQRKLSRKANAYSKVHDH